VELSAIDHVEFCAGDAYQLASHLFRAFDFGLSAESDPAGGTTHSRSLLLRHGDIRLVLTSGLRPEAPASEYVRRHGDGVVDLALGTPDATTAFEEAVAGGAHPVRRPQVHTAPGDDGRIVTATVSGFGDVTHTFVERRGSTREFLPGLRPVTAPATPRRQSMGDEPPSKLEPLHSIDHVAICLAAGDLEPTVNYYRKVLGFDETFTEHIVVGTQAMNSKVVQSPNRNITFTLLEPDVRHDPGQIDDFLRAHDGSGVQHLAFSTEDIAAAVAELQERGVEFLDTPDSYYDALPARLGGIRAELDTLREFNILADRDVEGELFQIFTRSLHVRRTFFLELIERRGADTFGSSNITALYEAVEKTRTPQQPIP
jgi:4-hydroxymandelate synthase